MNWPSHRDCVADSQRQYPGKPKSKRGRSKRDMSATSITIPANRPGGSPPAGLASLPVDLSHSPRLGILGVLLGAGIVTLTGRLLSLGLADLKGNVGIGFDDGAWISSAFNIALMFIGPFTVYLGALLGPRRGLL